jgi:hypothetical protein
MIGDEPHRPYNRTPLSKQRLTGDRHPDLALVPHTDLDASWRLGTRALGLDIDRRELLLPGGEQLPFDGLVIVSGVEARHLPGTPLHSDRVWMLRTLADTRNIDTALARARHVAVIGGGFIGCEIACTARTRALDVTVVDVSPTPLHRSLGSALGRRIMSPLRILATLDDRCPFSTFSLVRLGVPCLRSSIFVGLFLPLRPNCVPTSPADGQGHRAVVRLRELGNWTSRRDVDQDLADRVPRPGRRFDRDVTARPAGLRWTASAAGPGPAPSPPRDRHTGLSTRADGSPFTTLRCRRAT